jgi:hypothetical protein
MVVHMALPIAATPDPGSDDAAFVRAAVAEEVRSALARKKMSGAELARRLHKSEAWVSRRISLYPTQTFDLVELGEVATALGVSVKELIPSAVMGWSTDAPALTCVEGTLTPELPFPTRTLVLVPT